MKKMQNKGVVCLRKGKACLFIEDRQTNVDPSALKEKQ